VATQYIRQFIANFAAMDEKRVSDHLANERTFLAWVRTGLGIMAFGFVVVKFSLFMKQIALVLGSRQIKDIAVPQHGYSSIMGIFLVAFGVIITLLAYMRYKRVEAQLLAQQFKHSSLLISILMTFIFISGILLVAYLIYSV
jgi:putative membrane protein